QDHLAQQVPGQAEAAEVPARPAAYRAAVSLAAYARVARQTLQVDHGLPAGVVIERFVLRQFLEFGAPPGMLGRQLPALDVARHHRFLCHETIRVQFFRGRPNARSSASASSSVRADVVIAISIPRSASTLS